MANKFHINIFLVFCAFTLINIDKSICEPLDVGYWFRYLVNSDTSATDMPTLPPIIKSFENMPSENGYNYSLVTQNGFYRQETYELKNRGAANEEQFLKGIYKFTADDGLRYIVDYSSDKNGIVVTVEVVPFRRVPPNALKSLVG